jgi:hypothetical protein
LEQAQVKELEIIEKATFIKSRMTAVKTFLRGISNGK